MDHATTDVSSDLFCAAREEIERIAEVLILLHDQPEQATRGLGEIFLIRSFDAKEIVRNAVAGAGDRPRDPRI
jgi:hypothetical protein